MSRSSGNFSDISAYRVFLCCETLSMRISDTILCGSRDNSLYNRLHVPCLQAPFGVQQLAIKRHNCGTDGR